MWPVLAAFCLIYFFACRTFGFMKSEKVQLIQTITPLLFINNLTVDRDSPIAFLWTIAVEFQFYLISPLVVMYMARSERPILAPIAIGIVSLICSFIISA